MDLCCSVMSNSATPWTVTRQAPLSMEFFRQEFWSGLPFSSPGIFLTQGLIPHLKELQADSLPLSHQGSFYRTLGKSFDHCKHVFFFKSIFAFELQCWRRLLRVSWTARRSNQSILKEINPEYSLEGLMLKAEVPILWPPDANSQLIGKDPDAGKD